MNKIIFLICCLPLGVWGQISPWSFGLEKGYATIQGEVRPAAGIGLGAHISRHLGTATQLRLAIGTGSMSGQDLTSSTNWLNHPVWNGTQDLLVDYRTGFTDEIYANFQTMYQEASLQAIFSPTRLLVHEPAVDFFVVGGVGGMRYQTRIDASGEVGVYFFDLVDPAAIEQDRFTTLGLLMDGKPETTNQDNSVFTPLYRIGAGMSWEAREQVTISLTYRYAFSGTDNLDSYQYDANNAIEGVNDKMHLVSLGITFRPGKRVIRREQIEVAPMESLDEPIEEIEMPVIEELPHEVVLTEEEAEIVNRAFENTEFETNEAIIRDESFPSLNELADLLLEHPDWRLQITGHTDNMGEPDFNMQLSKTRAEAVRDYLAEKGISISRFDVSWFGETRPIATNNTRVGRQKNRRVEMVIVE